MILPEGLFAIYDQDYVQNLAPIEVIEAFLDAEAVPFIVRHKSQPKEKYRDIIAEINDLKREMDFDFIVHSDVELAKNTEALGVHLTARSESVASARKKLGDNSIIGYSAHSIEEALDVKRQGADYIFLGAIFETPKAHNDHPILGLKTLKEACRKIEIPIYAIGGINASNLIQIKEAGAAGFSALRAVYENGEVEHNISKLGFLWADFV